MHAHGKQLCLFATRSAAAARHQLAAQWAGAALALQLPARPAAAHQKRCAVLPLLLLLAETGLLPVWPLEILILSGPLIASVAAMAAGSSPSALSCRLLDA